MITTYSPSKAAAPIIHADSNPKYDLKMLKGIHWYWVYSRMKWHLLVLAIQTYGSLRTSIKVLKGLYRFKKLSMGKVDTKIIKINGKYYYHLYSPGYPSMIFDEYIRGEFNHIVPINKKADNLNNIFLAVTKKCPLMCDHCFEWDNLNKRESLELRDLKGIIKKFQKDGLAQFHLSGGEPLARIKDVVELIKTADKVSEFYVLTSGFNFTQENASLLKQAGLTGVVISLDHFDEEKHNAFRGFGNSFNQVKCAIKNAQRQNLVVALTICVTREFISWSNLMRYAEFAKTQNVAFIQLLEPKAVGHYKGKDVFLNKIEMELLEQFYEKMNLDPIYQDYPIIVYHGYHQRRIGCLSGGNRGLYIDSEGYVNACPFCHTKNFNIKDIIAEPDDFKDLIKESMCPSYNTDNVC
jgi:MoaA/NifB/PqqE/SkfB family radical SAM enzyme